MRFSLIFIPIFFGLQGSAFGSAIYDQTASPTWDCTFEKSQSFMIRHAPKDFDVVAHYKKLSNEILIDVPGVGSSPVYAFQSSKGAVVKSINEVAASPISPYSIREILFRSQSAKERAYPVKGGLSVAEAFTAFTFGWTPVSTRELCGTARDTKGNVSALRVTQVAMTRVVDGTTQEVTLLIEEDAQQNSK